MDPLVAFQLLAGPILIHLLTRPLGARLGRESPLEESTGAFVDAWLRAMTP
jgi:hypothetical protein